MKANRSLDEIKVVLADKEGGERTKYTEEVSNDNIYRSNFNQPIAFNTLNKTT